MSGGSCEGARDDNPEYGSEKLTDSALRYSLGAEGLSEIGFSDEIFEEEKCGKFDGSSLVEFLWVEVRTEVGPCDRMSDGIYFRTLEGSVER